MGTRLLLALVFIPMLVEARVAAVNERAQIARGGIEPAGDVYAVMRVAYPAVFLAMIAEGWWRGVTPFVVVTAGLLIFVSAKLLKKSTLKTYEKFPHGMCTTRADVVNPDILAFVKG